MTQVKQGLILVAALSAGLFCPTAAADADEGRRPAEAQQMSTQASEVDRLDATVGPPDPNGCRPYCR